MRFFIVVIIILLLPLILRFLGRFLGRWFRNYATGKMEDNLRRMVGMPTRAEEKKARKAAERKGGWAGATNEDPTQSGGHRYGFRSRGRNHNVGNPAEDLRMMRLYAEDVEYVEIREYSADIRFEQDPVGGHTRITVEEQLSDAEFVVIK